MNAPQHVRVETPLITWEEANRQWLVAALATLRDRFNSGADIGTPIVSSDCVQSTASTGFEPALVNLAKAFRLSPFERELLLLLAGLEIDDGLRKAFIRISGDPAGRATFGAALAVLVTPHWDALSPDGPLRQWRLMAPEPASALMLSPLRLDERILHFITGVFASDGALAGMTTRVAGKPAEAEDLPLARRIAVALQSGAVVVLDDGDLAFRRDWLAAAAAACRRDALWIEARDDTGGPRRCRDGRTACRPRTADWPGDTGHQRRRRIGAERARPRLPAWRRHSLVGAGAARSRRTAERTARPAL